MTKRILNRRAIREQNDQADAAAAPTAAAAPKAAKPKPAAKPRVRRKAVKVPPRLFARWAVCDNGMKRVAVFEYRDRTAADAKLATCSAIAATSATARSVPVSRATAAEWTVSQKLQ